LLQIPWAHTIICVYMVPIVTSIIANINGSGAHIHVLNVLLKVKVKGNM
jgi:hypothetical protein